MTNDRYEERREGEELATKAILIAQHYGLRNQLLIQAEECSELAKEALKLVRKLDSGERIISTEAILDEIADVTFINSQIVYLLDLDREIAKKMLEKANRQIARIAKKNKQEAKNAQ